MSDDIVWVDEDGTYYDSPNPTAPVVEVSEIDNGRYFELESSIELLKEVLSRFSDESTSNDPAMSSDVGGIDMNAIDIESSGTQIEFDFDPVMIQQLQEQNIQGFRPVTINFTPLPSILPLLGLDQSREPGIEVSRI